MSNYSKLDIKSLQHTNMFKPPKLNTLKYFSLEDGAGVSHHCDHHLSLSNASSLTVLADFLPSDLEAEAPAEFLTLKKVIHL